MKKIFKAGLALAFATGLLTLGLIGRGKSVPVQAATAQDPQFMVYYRAWRDKTMQGVNTSLPDKNTVAMTDLPTGIDIVNVFSFVPKGQEAQAKPFFDTLKSTYAPALHARGIKLVRAVGYGTLVNIPDEFGGDNPTAAQFDGYAKQLLQDLSGQWGLDGLDIDMEEKPSADEVKLSDGVIKALAKYIGPQSGNLNTLFIYDTNGSNMDPFENVKDAFNYLGYQQYGATSGRTQRAVTDYAKVGFDQGKFLAGLTFPEEQDNNRWYDTDPVYTNSHIYDIAKYVRENKLGGMFMYAVDRDGRSYETDSNRIVPTTFAWTKAAISEMKGISLDEAKAIANFYLQQNKSKWSADQVKTAQETINNGKNIYDVNKAFLNDDYQLALSPTFDPLAVKKEMAAADAAALATAKADGLAKIDAAVQTAEAAIAKQTGWSAWAKQTAVNNVRAAAAAAKKAINDAAAIAAVNTAVTSGVQQIEKAAATQPIAPIPPVQYPEPVFTFGANWVKDPMITVGQSFDPTAGIYAWTSNNYATAIVSRNWQIAGQVDTTRVGTYGLTYTITNDFGRTATLQRTITVQARSLTETPGQGVLAISNANGTTLYANPETTQSLGRTLTKDSAWRYFSVVKDAAGRIVAYNLGGRQYVQAADITTDSVKLEAGVFTVRYPTHPQWSIAVYNQDLQVQKLILPRSAWQTFGTKILTDGQSYYNLGGNQWARTDYGYWQSR